MAINGALGVLAVGVNVDLSQFNSGMDQIDRRAASSAQKINSIGSSFGTGVAMGAGIAATTAALSALEGVAGSAVGAIVGLSSTLEQARIGFTAFTGSAEKANDFIKQLQDLAQNTSFEFPSLLQGSRQLMGMGVAAEQVIPLMKDVATAVMAVGGGDEQIKRVNLALTQMLAAGKVNAQDMNQLTNAGIPAWKLLADSMGLSIGQVRELSKQGKITAAEMIKALDDMAHRADMSDILAKSNATWQTATSNIIDGLRNIGTEGFSPLFSVMRDFAVQLANALSVQNTAQFTADLKATVQQIIDLAAPLGEAFQRAFAAFKTDGISGALNSVLADAQALAQQMFGAGINVVEQFASGLIGGAANLIENAANSIAQIIADYLIGNSPPPVGPLSAIATGGANVIAAYVEGMQGGLGGLAGIAQQVTDALGNVSKSLTLADATAELKNAGANLDALKGAAEDVDGALRTIDDHIKENQSSLRDYQNAASDIKDAFEAAIDPLQKQVDALTQVNDLATKQADIQDRIRLAGLKDQLNKAQGDPVQRGKLQEQLELLDQQSKGLELQQRQVELDKQQADIAAKAAGKTAPKSDAADSARANQLAQQRLGIQQQQNAIQMQLQNMVDKEAVARIKTQQTQVTAVKDQRDLNSEVADLNRQLQAAPLEAQIKDLKGQEQGLLTPIQDRIKQYEREAQTLQAQRQQWQGIKADIADVVQATKAAAVAQEAASKKAALANPVDLSTILKPEAITHTAELVGQSWLTGFGGYLQAHAMQIIGGAIGGALGGAAFGPLGAIAGAVFGADFAKAMQDKFGSADFLGGKIAGKLSDALNIDTSGAQNSLEAFAIIFEQVRDRALTALEALRTGAIDKVKGIQDSLSGVQTWWQDTFGDQSAGSQAGIQAIDAVNKAFQALQLLLEGNVKGAIDTLKQSFTEFGGAGSSASDQVNQSFTDLKGVLTDLAPIAAGVATTFLVFRTLTTVVAVITGITAAWGALSATIAASGGVVAAIVALLGGPITIAIGVVALAIGALTAAWLGNWGNIQGITATAVAAIQTGFNAMVAFIGNAWNTISSATIAAWGAIQQGFTDGIALIQGLWNAGWKAVSDTVTAAWNLITPENQAKIADLIATTGVLWDTLGQLWNVGTAALATTLSGWWSTISSAVAGYWAEFTAGVATLWTNVQAKWNEGTKGVSDALTICYALLNALTETLFTDLGTKWTAAKATLGSLATALGQSIMQALTTAINTAVGGVVDAVTGAVKRAIDAAQSLIQSFGASASAGGGPSGSLMSYTTGGSSGPLKSVDTSSSQTALKSWVGALMDAQQKTGIPARTLWGIIMAENGGGQSQLSRDSNNYFSISAVSGRPNQSGAAPGGRFASYATPQASLDDFLSLITQSPSYANANANKGDVDKFIKALVDAHYIVPEAGFPVDTWINNVKSGAANFDNMISQLPLKPSMATMSNTTNGGIGAMQMNKSQMQAGAESGLSNAEAAAACGPYAAVLFSQAVGRNPTLAEATELAAKVGWTAARGMAGTGSEMALLGRMGINAVQQAATPENVNAALGAGHPIALSTPKHYFVGTGGTAGGGINVGATGTVMGGQATMTLDQINALGGGTSQLIVLMGSLDKAGTQTFEDLTHVAGGQFGPALQQTSADTSAAIIQFTTDGIAAGTQLSASNAGLVASTTTLSESISAGLVPAGLAAVGAVGQMSIGIQPLIAQFANGQINTEQLGQAIVGLAASTGLTTQPLAAMQAGTLSTNAALRVVLASLTAADPAFGAIQQAFDATAQTSGDLAVSLEQGLANVTGQVTPALAQMAQGVQPLQAAFASGQISADQFVQGVVQLAATSGLTQAPLRLMQDGVISANDALAQVVQSAGAADPAIASMGVSIGDSVQPATDAATAFLAWIASLQQTQQAVDDSNTAVQQVPQAVSDIQQPVADASQTTMQALPDATNAALDATVQAISDKTGPAADAATAVGQAIVDALVKTVQDGASTIADAAMQVIQDALDAAKKAADAATANIGSKTTGSGSSKKKTKTSSGSKSKTEAKALGGPLTPGTWTLVGEYGPELIGPDGYVYTAQETLGMVQDGIVSGITDLERFASGGSSKTKSGSSSSSKSKSGSSSSKSKSKSGSADAAPKKQQTPEYTEELDIGQKVLELTQQRDKLLVQMLPIQESIRKEEEAMQAAQKGSLADQLTTIANKKASLEIDSKIYHLTYDENSLHTSTHNIELKIRDVKAQQQAASDGDELTQEKLNNLNMIKLQQDAEIARIQVVSIGTRNQAKVLEQQIADIQKGTLEQQLQTNKLQTDKDNNLVKENTLQQQSAGLRAAVADQEQKIADLQKGSVDDQKKLADIAVKRAEISVKQADEQAAIVPIQNQINTLQKQIDESLKGSAANRKIIADNAARTLLLDGQSLQVQQTMLPIQESIRQVQNQIDAVSKGSLATQQAAVDLQTEQAKIQLQEIDINKQLRNVNAGTLNLSQESINALQKQLEVLDNQKANLDDQTQVQQLQATITNADAQKKLLALQDQAKTQQDISDGLDYQKSVLQNQTDIINNTNQKDTQSKQDQLTVLQDQLAVHQNNADELNAQVGILDAQKGVIDASSAVQVAQASATLTDLQNQLAVYDQQITLIEQQNSAIDLQMQGIAAQNQARSDVITAQLIGVNAQVDAYDKQVAQLQLQNDYVSAQSGLITANNAVAAAGFANELTSMQSILNSRNAEIQQLTDQKNLIDAQTGEINTQNQIAATGHEAQLAQLNAQLVAMDTLSGDLNAQIGSLNAQKKIYQDIRDLADAIANRPKSTTPAPVTTAPGTGGPPGTVSATATKDGQPTLYLSRGTGVDGWYTNSGQLVVQGGSASPPSGYKVKYLAEGGLLRAGEMAIVGENGPEPIIAARDMVVFPSERTMRARSGGTTLADFGGDSGSNQNVTVNVEYHRHSGTDYGEGTLSQVVREAVYVALRQ